MKKLCRLMMLAALALFAIGCSAPSDPSIESVDLGEVQQSLLSCPRPSGSYGSQLTPILGYITGVHVNATYPFLLDVEFSYDDPETNGPPSTGYIDFGYGQADFTGAGWSGTKITSMGVKTPNSTGCMFGTDLFCWVINGTVALKMNQQASNLIPSNGVNTTQYYGNGVTKLRGMAATDPQKFRIYWDDAGSISYNTWTALGPELTECADPN